MMEQPRQPERGILPVKITDRLRVELVQDSNRRKLLRINGEPLAPEQLDLLLACILSARRRGRQARYDYPRFTRLPQSLRVPRELGFTWGRIERSLNSGTEPRLED